MLDIDHLSKQDIDIMSLGTKEVMKKYKLEKQPVYDRRFALNKKIKAAGLSLEQILHGTGATTELTESAHGDRIDVKENAVKHGKEAEPAVKSVAAAEPVTKKEVAGIMKPIEINFKEFSVRINGVPRKISVNSENSWVEIDL